MYDWTACKSSLNSGNISYVICFPNRLTSEILKFNNLFSNNILDYLANSDA